MYNQVIDKTRSNFHPEAKFNYLLRIGKISFLLAYRLQSSLWHSEQKCLTQYLKKIKHLNDIEEFDKNDFGKDNLLCLCRGRGDKRFRHIHRVETGRSVHGTFQYVIRDSKISRQSQNT